jgi:hypothetical protein
LPSLLTYCRDVAVELGPFVVNTTTTASSDLVSFTCSALLSGNACGAQFQSCWAYLNASTGPNLAAQRSILNAGGYDPDVGSVTVARAFSTIVTSGMGFEILSKVPRITDEMGTRGIREIVNDVLLTLPPIDLLPVTGVTNQAAYDLTTLYSWLVSKDQILGIYFQRSGDDHPTPAGVSWDWEYDADAPRLLLPGRPYVTGDTFYVKAHRPAQSWIKQTTGTWSSDTDGLQYDSEEALPLRQVIRAHALAGCYRQLGTQQGPDEYISYYQSREAFWSKKAYALRWWDDQKSDEDRAVRVRMVWPGGGYGHSKAYG